MSETSTDANPKPAWLRPLIEFGPLITFFIVQRNTERLDGLYWATVALIITTSFAVVVSRVVEKRWPMVPLVTGVIVAIMGGLTIHLESEWFIKAKPTILYSIFGGVLLGGLKTGHILLKSVMGHALPMADSGWRILTLRISLVFLGLAALNEVLRRVLNTDDWTLVKTFGYAAILFVFLILQGPLLEAHSTAPKEPKEGPDEQRDEPRKDPDADPGDRPD